MKPIKGIMLIAALSLALLNNSPCLAAEPVQPQQASAQPETETQWVWGEVISVDTQNKAVWLKYLDYDTDTETEIAITTDEKTSFESVNSLDGIRPLDTISVDYITAADGKNLARNISVERPEESPLTEEQAVQDAPAGAKE